MYCCSYFVCYFFRSLVIRFVRQYFICFLFLSLFMYVGRYLDVFLSLRGSGVLAFLLSCVPSLVCSFFI